LQKYLIKLKLKLTLKKLYDIFPEIVPTKEELDAERLRKEADKLDILVTYKKLEKYRLARLEELKQERKKIILELKSPK